MKNRFRTSAARLVATVAVLALGAVIATAPAGSAPGQYITGSGYCWVGEMLATPPSMYPNQDTGIVGGSQLVGFRSLLQRWDARTGTWKTVAQAPLLKRQVGWTELGIVGDWYTTTGQEVTGTARFNLTYQSGYFRFMYAMYWYSSTGAVTGSVVAPAWGHRDDRPSSVTTTGWSYVDWCQY